MNAPPSDSTSRTQVMKAVRTATVPPTVGELAAELGLHPNSVRLHTAALRDAGLIDQQTRPRAGRGRPHVVYTPTALGARSGDRNYADLAGVLLDHLVDTAEDPVAAARHAGRSWGARLLAARREQRDIVPAVLTDLGFEPDARAGSIELRNCPFRELVDTHRGLVCALHAGMVDGLARHRPSTTLTLLPFTSPTACTVQVEDR